MYASQKKHKLAYLCERQSPVGLAYSRSTLGSAVYQKLQQISCVLQKNTEALLKIYGLDTEKNADLDIWNIDFRAAASKAFLNETKSDSCKLSPQKSH